MDTHNPDFYIRSKYEEKASCLWDRQCDLFYRYFNMYWSREQLEYQRRPHHIRPHSAVLTDTPSIPIQVKSNVEYIENLITDVTLYNEILRSLTPEMFEAHTRSEEFQICRERFFPGISDHDIVDNYKRIRGKILVDNDKLIQLMKKEIEKINSHPDLN